MRDPDVKAPACTATAATVSGPPGIQHALSSLRVAVLLACVTCNTGIFACVASRLYTYALYGTTCIEEEADVQYILST
jgi:hypothetical protein